MDGLADVGGIRAHLDGETHFADQIAGVRADNAAADALVSFGIKQQLREPLVASIGNGPA